MKRAIITMQSATAAMKGQRMLAANGIGSEIVRLPPKYSDAGCSYGLRIAYADGKPGVRVLQVSDIPFGRLVTDDTEKQTENKGRNR
ncbi:MAG: DUF3343 domain-containing protein [Eubacteriales bacterium]